VHYDTRFLDPALPLLWRAPGTLQVGLDHGRAVALSGVTPEVAERLRQMSTPVVGAGAAIPADPALARATQLLEAAGLLLRQHPHQRWALAWVQVVGTGPVVDEVAAGLRAAGVGRCTTALEATPAGPDLVVVASTVGRALSAGAPLARSATAHLWAHLRDGRAVVGPLVVPAGSSCLRCHDLHRTDADPCWPALAVAWEQQPSSHVPPATVSLLAGVTVRQCLAWLRGARPATVDGTLEEQPDGQVVRVAWSVHPGCGCGWAGPYGQDASGDPVQ
jgi:hypothetical protein